MNYYFYFICKKKPKNLNVHEHDFTYRYTAQEKQNYAIRFTLKVQNTKIDILHMPRNNINKFI